MSFSWEVKVLTSVRRNGVLVYVTTDVVSVVGDSAEVAINEVKDIAKDRLFTVVDVLVNDKVKQKLISVMPVIA